MGLLIGSVSKPANREREEKKGRRGKERRERKKEEGKDQKRKKGGGGGKETSGHGIQTSMWTPHLCDISYKATQK